ncbi:MAG: LutB/LldF family L-lactate oxidation iron-sulfur protein [Opitutales bacterium]|nr:LutB/LldF family L-lactate oxidation iron-sulfur protein [Opitutales bacterium]
MKTYQPIDAFARDAEPEVKASVYSTSKAKYDKRLASLSTGFTAPDDLRKLAGQIKQHTIEHLDQYLEQAVTNLENNGAKVHFASTPEDANQTILGIMQSINASRMIKSKSMVSEEIHLNAFLEKHGLESVESDLGEFIVQLDDDMPSHIVTPIIHKNRRQIATTFEKHGLGDYNDDPETITRRARKYLREKYLEAEVGLTGANFLSAESGRVAIVTNEGNARFSISANRTHIVLLGIEKLVPRDKDLALYLNLLARSATGQQLTVYTQFLNAPKSADQPDGPEQLHVVFLDNGRSEILGGEFKSILRCIRCGACLNVCPVYRQSSGHAYRAVYPGPVGAVLSPLLKSNSYPDFADLPKASSLCGACNEVCPVDIPLPELLLRHRNKSKIEHQKKAAAGTPPLGAWAELCSHPTLWKTTLATGKAMNHLPIDKMPIPPIQAWTHSRELPEFRGGKFRKWFKQRKS